MVANDDFLDDYVTNAPLEGDSYAIDSVQVHTLLLNFVPGNDTAEAKIQGLQRPNDGREAFKRLVEHYEGEGIHAIDIREADEVLKILCGGLNLRRDSQGRSTHTSNAKGVLFTQTR
jgi:hypothetical protein